jgi:hypothetical protein
MGSKAIRKVYSLGRKHGKARYFTLPKTWFRWLEEEHYLVPKRVTFETRENHYYLIIRPDEEHNAADLNGRPRSKVLTIGLTSSVVKLPWVWCLDCDRRLSDKKVRRKLQWVWMTIGEKEVTLEPASREEHDEREVRRRRERG